MKHSATKTEKFYNKIWETAQPQNHCPIEQYLQFNKSSVRVILAHAWILDNQTERVEGW